MMISAGGRVGTPYAREDRITSGHAMGNIKFSYAAMHFYYFN
jgi:hypothetical protein